MMVAALFVQKNGAYFGLPDVDPWDEARDARKYKGPHRVVAHPPCERWGRYWSGGPSAKVRRLKGDDNGCFLSALWTVRQWGGVLEHPQATHAWERFGLRRPKAGAGWWAGDGWQWGDPRMPRGRDWVCEVEQGHYGHPARKKTWLYVVSNGALPALAWGPSKGIRLDEGFHSAAERKAARTAGVKPVKRLTTAQNLATPPAFRDQLLSIARGDS